MTLVKRNRETITCEPLRCRSWQCEHCNPMRRKRCIREAAHGEPNTFITLTVNPEWFDTPHDRAKALVRAWREVRRLACKKYGYDRIPFYAVFEKCESGEPHLHILARVPWIDHGWLSATMARLNGAPVVDIRRIDKARKPQRYIAKYLGKDLCPFEGVKRYWKSLDWLDTKTRSEWICNFPADDFEVWRMSFYDAMIAARKQGVALTPYSREGPYVVALWESAAAQHAVSAPTRH